MSENPNSSSEEKSTGSEAWREVGQQFQALGQSLAAAFRTSVNDEENRRRMRQMQDGLESMVSEVNKAIHDAAESPKGQQVRSDVEKTAENLRAAGEEAVQEVRPQLLTALKQVTQELQKLVERMEKKEKPDDPGAGTA
jgi:hypothetical protein